LGSRCETPAIAPQFRNGGPQLLTARPGGYETSPTAPWHDSALPPGGCSRA